MILFYVVSDLGLMNAINVRENVYPKEKAVLITRYVGGSSDELIEAVIKSKIFDRVELMPFPLIDNKKGLFGKIPGFRAYGETKKYKIKMFDYLDSLEIEDKVDKLFVMHLESFAIFVVSYFRKRNRDIKVEFIEEGTASYLCDYKYMTRPMRWTLKYRTYVIKKLSEHRIRSSIKSSITKRLYLYSPETYDPEMGFVPQKIRRTERFKSVLDEINSYDTIRHQALYNSHDIYFFGNSITLAEPTFAESYAFIDLIIQNVPADYLLIKVHTNASTECRDNYALPYEEEGICAVDRECIPTEAVLNAVDDLSNKILVARASSLILNIKSFFECEPYIILTFRMYDYYNKYGDEGGDSFLEIMRARYSDPDKVAAPRNRFEFKECLKKYFKKIHPEIDLDKFHREYVPVDLRKLKNS